MTPWIRPKALHDWLGTHEHSAVDEKVGVPGYHDSGAFLYISLHRALVCPAASVLTRFPPGVLHAR
jgi:hypothetical protein